MEEMIDIVDEQDNVTGQATWQEMQGKALIHRAANILVFNSKGALFVHKRAAGLALYPKMYDVKFGGVARAGESYENCARRELKEEAGIEKARLEFLFPLNFRSSENNNNRKVYKTIYDGRIKLQKEEVESGRFMTIEEAKTMMEEGKLSPSAVHVFKEFLKMERKK